jgi:hypothetical protein
MPTPLWPDLEGDAAIFENLPGYIRWAIGPPLIGRSWVSEASAILPPANPWHRFLAMAIESNESSSKAFSQIDEDVVTIEFRAFQDDQRLAAF